MTTRLNDALAAARQAAALQPSGERPALTGAAAMATTPMMAPAAMTPLAPPRVGRFAATEAQARLEQGETLPGTVPTARRELFDRTREALFEQLAHRDLGALPPSWAGVSGRLTQEEAASAVAALQLIAARVSP